MFLEMSTKLGKKRKVHAIRFVRGRNPTRRCAEASKCASVTHVIAFLDHLFGVSINNVVMAYVGDGQATFDAATSWNKIVPSTPEEGFPRYWSCHFDIVTLHNKAFVAMCFLSSSRVVIHLHEVYGVEVIKLSARRNYNHPPSEQIQTILTSFEAILGFKGITLVHNYAESVMDVIFAGLKNVTMVNKLDFAFDVAALNLKRFSASKTMKCKRLGKKEEMKKEKFLCK